MNSKLKCPFCQQELVYDSGIEQWCCDKCHLSGGYKLWQELILTRKTLEIARKVINQVMSMGAKNNICYHLKAKTVKSILGNALEQIEQKD